MKKFELKECPFCGSSDTLDLRKVAGDDGFRDRYFVLCDWNNGGCGGSGGVYHTADEAVAWWNERANEGKGNTDADDWEKKMDAEVRCRDCRYGSSVEATEMGQQFVKCKLFSRHEGTQYYFPKDNHCKRGKRPGET